MLSKSKIQTQRIAASLAKKILRTTSYALRAKAIVLHGDLGAGKTTFVQGFMKALGVKQHITSPTFLIIRKYQIKGGRTSLRKNLEVRPPKIKPQFAYHLDLYRIHKPQELLVLGFREIIKNPQNIVLIEWPERIKKLLPKNLIWIAMEHGKKENERIIDIFS